MRRRQFIAAAGAGLLVGCSTFGPHKSTTPTPQMPTETPSAAALVAFLSRNAAAVQTLEATDLALDIKADGKAMPGVGGTLHCEKPRSFRMRAKSIAGQEADFGSNNNEFWYWIKRDNPPYQYHCDYAAVSRGVRLPFPFQPDWVMETLGLAGPAAADNCRVEVKAGAYELVERATGLQGQPVQKVTVFYPGNAYADKPQITGYRLEEANGQVIAKATITSVKRDAATQVRVPRVVHLEWPAQRLELTLTLDGLTVNSPNASAQRNGALYVRQPVGGAQSFDLARGTLDGAVQPAGNVFRRTGG